MNGFTRSLDRKIEASKRRQAEEQRGQAHNKAPTQGLTDLASTANNNVPMRKPTATVRFPLGITVLANELLEIDVETGNVSIIDPSAPSYAQAAAVATTASRSRVPIDQICTIPEAMDRLNLAMKEDPDYARTWHDNIAMAFYDAEQDDTLMTEREHANRAAALFMERAFSVDTRPKREDSFWANLANARPMGAKIVKNTGIAGSLDAQLAAAKAESPASIIEALHAHLRYVAEMEHLRSIPPEAPGGMNEAKARGMRHFFGGSQWDEPVKADLSDAKGCITQRLMTSAEVEALLTRDINRGCSVIAVDAKGVMASETYIRRMQLDPKV